MASVEILKTEKKDAAASKQNDKTRQHAVDVSVMTEESKDPVRDKKILAEKAIQA